MEQIKLLFDTSLLVENINSKNTGRTGIYWATYNILFQFSQNPLYQITLLVPPLTFFTKKTELGIFLSSFPSVTVIERTKYDINIKIHKKNIKQTRNIFFIGIRCLMIFKNTLLFSIFNIIPRYKHIDNFDAFFSPFPAIPEKIKNVPSIIIFHVLHDCIPFLNGVHTMGVDSNHLFVQLAKGLSQKIYYLCNSLSTKNDFLKLFPNQLDEKKVFVIPHASSHNFIPNYDKTLLQKVLKKYGVKLNPNDLYIFSLCSIDPRKNLIFTVKCFIEFIKKHNIENLYFYLGGGHFKGYISQFVHEISSFKEYTKKIIQLGYIDDEDVNILYSNSLFFTFLSQYEGFGVPPLEAMQAGTPVICSNNSSLPEVVGDAAITINYDNGEQCIKAFEDLYFNENLRKHHIRKGLERAKLFSWEKTANKMTDIIVKYAKNIN